MQTADAMDLLAEKARKLAARRQAAKKLSSDVDAELRADAGCLPCTLWRRRRRDVASAEDVEAAATSAAAANGAEGRAKAGTASALFGLAKKQASPVDKLAEAAEAVAQRAVALETKVGEGRAEARALMLGGQKKAALRQMRRVKMIEGQLASVQSAADALEQQQLVLEQAALQKEMTSALSSSAKGLKKSKKLLSQAETAVEDASEARDAADDLSNVLAEFTTTSMLSADDDELLAELEEMAAAGDGGGSGDGDGDDEADAAEDEATRAARDAEEIERRDRAWREAEATRARMPVVPSSRGANGNGKGKGKGKGKAVEKQVLLAAE